MKMHPSRTALWILIAATLACRLGAQEPNSSSAAQRTTTLHGQIDEPKLIETEIYRNNSFGAYSKALKESKYTVILFRAGNLDPFSPRLFAKVHDPRLAQYSGRIRFSYTDEDLDEGAKQLVEALGVVRYPTLVVLKTNAENIHVAGRIEGEVTVDEIDRVFREAMKEPIKTPATPVETLAKARAADE